MTQEELFQLEGQQYLFSENMGMFITIVLSTPIIKVLCRYLPMLNSWWKYLIFLIVSFLSKSHEPR